VRGRSKIGLVLHCNRRKCENIHCDFITLREREREYLLLCSNFIFLSCFVLFETLNIGLTLVEKRSTK